MPLSPRLRFTASTPIDQLLKTFALEGEKTTARTSKADQGDNPVEVHGRAKKIRKTSKPLKSKKKDIPDLSKASKPVKRKKKIKVRDNGEPAIAIPPDHENLPTKMQVVKEAQLAHGRPEAQEVQPHAKPPVCVKKRGTKRKSSLILSAPVDEPKSLQEKQRKAEVPVAPALGVEAYRKLHQIIVKGTCPAPFETFDAVEASFGQSLTSCLRQQGYDAPTPIQAQAWPIAMRRQDLVAVAKTGSGKTCGFLLPALANFRSREKIEAQAKAECATPQVLVLVPTRELAQQVCREAEKFSVAANCRVVEIYGGVPKGEQVRELKLGADVVVATPGRLLDFSKGNPEKKTTPLVSMKFVTYLVLDEADRMLDMGFEPDIRKIVSECPASAPSRGSIASRDSTSLTRQTLFFTATWPTQVQATASSLTSSNAVQVRIGQGADGDQLTANTNVKQIVSVEDERQKLTKLKEVLQRELAPGESCFVFAKTRHTCDYLEQKLWDEKEDLSISTWCRAIHSHREQWEREANLATFRNITTGKDNGRRGILVATDVAARGLDIPGVALVIVYDFGGGGLGHDSGVESYVHRIGRTGRAGKMGKAFTFFTVHDTGAAKLVELLYNAKQKVSSELRDLAEKECWRRGRSCGKGSAKGKGGWSGKGTRRENKGSCKGGKGKGKRHTFHRR